MGRPTVDAYPLAWPPGRPRTAAPESSRFRVTKAAALAAVRYEVDRLGGSELVISTNVPVRADGEPIAGRRPITDTGAAVYFTLRKAPMCFACDRWIDLSDNLRAIAKTIDALRGIERWGSGQMVAQAFTGFTALPAPEQWWQVLKIKSTAAREDIESAFRVLAFTNHPDRGGDEHTMARINRARDQGLEQFDES